MLRNIMIYNDKFGKMCNHANVKYGIIIIPLRVYILTNTLLLYKCNFWNI